MGGTFDPPHKGHIHISKIALKKLKLNKIVWVITKKNPLKKNSMETETKETLKRFKKYLDNQGLTQKTFADYVMFQNSGTEATEAAIKVARKYFHKIGKPEKNNMREF